jgi:hypothetical protein
MDISLFLTEPTANAYFDARGTTAKGKRAEYASYLTFCQRARGQVLPRKFVLFTTTDFPSIERHFSRQQSQNATA